MWRILRTSHFWCFVCWNILWRRMFREAFGLLSNLLSPLSCSFFRIDHGLRRKVANSVCDLLQAYINIWCDVGLFFHVDMWRWNCIVNIPVIKLFSLLLYCSWQLYCALLKISERGDKLSLKVAGNVKCIEQNGAKYFRSIKLLTASVAKKWNGA